MDWRADGQEVDQDGNATGHLIHRNGFASGMCLAEVATTEDGGV